MLTPASLWGAEDFIFMQELVDRYLPRERYVAYLYKQAHRVRAAGAEDESRAEKERRTICRAADCALLRLLPRDPSPSGSPLARERGCVCRRNGLCKRCPFIGIDHDHLATERARLTARPHTSVIAC